MSQYGVRISFLALVALLPAGLVGCSGSGAVHQASAEYPTWPALERFRDDELMMPIAMSADHGNWEQFRSLVVADNYRAAVEEFASTPVPGRWATPERTAAKDKAVAGMKALIEAAAQKKPAAELETLWRTLGQDMGEVTKATG